MEQLTLRLKGTAPLLMHRPLTVDPTQPLTQEIKKYTGKRKKTLDDHKTIARLEWEAGLYHDSEIGPYLPGVNLEVCLRDAGKITKQGAQVTRAVVVLEDRLPVLYPGPRGNNGHGLQEIYDANLKLLTRVGNQNNSVMRCRPMFPSWSMEVPLVVEESILDAGDVVEIAKRAGLMVALGDYRPRYGRFEVEVH